MRKLTQTLLIMLGCFCAAGIYASVPTGNGSEEEVTTTEGDGTSTGSELRLFHEGDNSSDDEKK